MTTPREITDIGEIVLLYAKDIFDRTKDKEQKKIPEEALSYNINWKNVRFIHEEPKYTDSLRPQHPKAQVLFKTYFTNNTDQEQEYSFKTERITRSTCEIQISRGVTTEQELSVKLATPCEVFEANAGFRREISLEKSEGQIAEEELCWGVDSQIKVPARCRTIAKLVVTEDEFGGNFTIHSKMEGKVLITVTNARENNCLVKTIEGNIAKIFTKEIKNGLKQFRVENNAVHFDTVGRCHFRYGVEQNVELHQEKLTPNGKS